MNRLPQLDALRGFALVGIVLGNVLWFSGVAVAPPSDADPSIVDKGLVFGLHLLVEGKFYALFSLLFGASFALMVRSEETRGRPALARVRRRLGSLFIVGAAHATLLWFGDILSLYAVAAVPLYLLLHRSDQAQLRWALALLLAPAAISVTFLMWHDPGDFRALGYGPSGQLWAFARGGAFDVLDANAAFLAQRWVLALASGRLPRLLGMFLLGALWVRRQPTISVRGRITLWSVALSSNLALALLAGTPSFPPSPMSTVRDMVSCVALPTGCLTYVSVLWPALAQPSRLRRLLGAAGRLSLTHYLSQSLVLASLFYGVGLGMWGSLGTASAVAVGGGLAIVQVLLSPLWLRTFGRGPGERLLRLADRGFECSDSSRREQRSDTRSTSLACALSGPDADPETDLDSRALRPSESSALPSLLSPPAPLRRPWKT